MMQMADYSKDFQVSYDGERDAYSIRFRCFDTPNSITVFDCAQGDLSVVDLLLAARDECLELHRLWSFTLEGSDVWRINERAERVDVDARTASLVSAMKAFHDVEPVFDFTVGPVSYLWKHAERVPRDEEIEAALAHVGADKVAVEGTAIVKADPLTQVDVGGAAKGFAADAIGELIREAGVASANIDLGGNLYMLGSHPSGRPWRVAVRIPEGIDVKKPVLEVCDQSVVTSGSYERFVEIAGERYQHIIDVSTGRPSESDFVSATVVAKSSLQADMLATSALLVGSQGIDALRARHPDAEFVVIDNA